jgi:hypothetical protein
MSKARDVYKEIEFALLLVIERSVEFLGGGLKLVDTGSGDDGVDCDLLLFGFRLLYRFCMRLRCSRASVDSPPSNCSTRAGMAEGSHSCADGRRKADERDGRTRPR